MSKISNHIIEQKDSFLSEHFSYSEMTFSATAQRKGLENIPPGQCYRNLYILCQEILEPIRAEWEEPILVSSGYRCPELNRIVGGVSHSDHMYGCAADIKTLGDLPHRNRALFDLIRKMYKEGKLPKLKQVIDEYNYDWIHISFQDGRSKKLGQFIHISK